MVELNGETLQGRRVNDKLQIFFCCSFSNLQIIRSVPRNLYLATFSGCSSTCHLVSHNLISFLLSPARTKAAESRPKQNSFSSCKANHFYISIIASLCCCAVWFAVVRFSPKRRIQPKPKEVLTIRGITTRTPMCATA